MSVRRVLVANRGEIAVRIVRACFDEGIESVAAVSDADLDSLAARRADAVVRIGPAAASASYLDVGAIVGAAIATGCDAVHPGYGFLSERPELAAECDRFGLAFVGPPAEVIRRGGSKIGARALARSIGVPVGEGSDRAATPQEAAAAAERIGYPVLLKASAGGGGRGMVRVDAPAALPAAFASAAREAAAAFGDGTLFVERWIGNARHVEVQVLADEHGSVIHLGERDCSAQRRFQKIVEEAPACGPSLPSTEQTLANLTRLGHSHGIDESTLPPVARNCERIAEQEGWQVSEPVEYDAFVYRHQLPGGMTGTLKAQLAQYGMSDRLDEVLEECVRVRAEFGHPISATPFSQIVGIQAVLNIVTGDRYSMAPDEAILYLMNAFGVPPAPVDGNVRDKVLNSEHGRRFAGWERPQPSLKELRDQYGGPWLSDEELLLRYMVPAEDIDATRAAGPLRTDYPFAPAASVGDLIARFGELKRTHSLRVRHPDFALDLNRG